MQNTEEYFKIQNTEEAESDLKLEYTEEDQIQSDREPE